jgi:hypothetical protein
MVIVITSYVKQWKASLTISTTFTAAPRMTYFMLGLYLVAESSTGFFFESHIGFYALIRQHHQMEDEI